MELALHIEDLKGEEGLALEPSKGHIKVVSKESRIWSLGKG